MSSAPSGRDLALAMARQFPEAHPYTLALLIQAQHGRTITGLEVRRILVAASTEVMPVQIGA